MMTKKNTCLTLTLLLLTFSSIAQDLIVLQKGDSIHCKITNQSKSKIFFHYKDEGVKRFAFLRLSEVKVHEMGFYSGDGVVNQSLILEEMPLNWSFDLHAGYSKLLMEVPEDLPPAEKDFVNGLNTGMNLGADLVYYWAMKLGYGFKANVFLSSQSAPHNELFDDPWPGDFLQEVRIVFAGPQVSFRFFNKKQTTMFHPGIAVGYMHAKFHSQVSGDYQLVTGSTLSVAIDLNYDIKLREDLFAGLRVSYLGGKLSEVSVGDVWNSYEVALSNDRMHDLKRMDISVGVRFLF